MRFEANQILNRPGAAGLGCRVVIAGFCLLALAAPAGGLLSLRLSEIAGESTQSGHAGEIEVGAWSWGASSTATPTGGARVALGELALTKWVDIATPRLMQAACSGKRFDQAVLTVRRAGDARDYYRLELTGARVVSVAVSGAGGTDRPTENLALSFETFKMDYIAPAPPGTVAERVGSYWDDLLLAGGSFVGEPVRATDFVASLAFSAGASSAGISWSAVPGKQYRLLFSAGLDEPFVPFSTNSAGGAQTLTVAVPMGRARGFFRVEEAGP
jgi:type VI secretion system secreted protein Hcp